MKPLFSGLGQYLASLLMTLSIVAALVCGTVALSSADGESHSLSLNELLDTKGANKNLKTKGTTICAQLTIDLENPKPANTVSSCDDAVVQNKKKCWTCEVNRTHSISVFGTSNGLQYPQRTCGEVKEGTCKYSVFDGYNYCDNPTAIGKNCQTADVEELQSTEPD